MVLLMVPLRVIRFLEGLEIRVGVRSLGLWDFEGFFPFFVGGLISSRKGHYISVEFL